MAKDISEIRKEIYDFAKDYEIFKNNSFLEACFKLTCAAENYFLNVMVSNVMVSLVNPIAITYLKVLQENTRACYREALKHAYRYCKNEQNAHDKLQIESSELDKITEELTSFNDFNQVRNLFEQYELGKYSISVNSENEITFERNKAKRSIDAELYARWMDKQKPELVERQLNDSAEMELYLNMVAPYNSKYWNFKDKSFSDFNHLKNVYELAIKKFTNDAEEFGDYDFGIFTTEDFQKVYAVLIAISVTNINYHFHSRMIGRTEIDKNMPIVVFQLNELSDFIKKLTNLKEETIIAVINKLNYDADFHKDKITIFQPLFIAQNKVFFSPSLIYYGMAYSKLLYVFKSDETYKPIISRIARDREKIMTDDLCDFINEKSELLFTANYTVKDGSTSLAEFDLILYDEKCKKMLLCELKWFFLGDGEYESAKVDKRIQDFIGKRLKKEEIAKSHLDKIKRELDIEEDEGIEIQSCIISKNTSGSDFLEDDLPVFDVFLFKRLLEDVNFDLEQFFELIKTKSYLPSMEEIAGYVKRKAEYAGYKINMESIDYNNIF